MKNPFQYQKRKKLKEISLPLTRKRSILFALIFSLVILSSAIYWFSSGGKFLDKSNSLQTEINKREVKFGNLLASIQAAENSLRRYSTTGNKEFLNNCSNEIDSTCILFNALQADSPSGKDIARPELYDLIDRLITGKIANLKKIKDLSDSNDLNKAGAILAGKEGKLLTDSILKVNLAINLSILDSNIEFAKSNSFAINKRNKVIYFGIVSSMLIISLVFYLLIKEINRTSKIGEDLFQQKEQFKIILNSMGEGLITTDTEGNILYLNPAAERLTGWKNANARNQPLQKVYNVVSESTGMPFNNIISRILKEKKIVDTENHTILKTKTGRSLIISNNGAPLLDSRNNMTGAVIVFNDITEKTKTKNELSDYKIALDRSTIVAITDHRGMIKYVNENFCKASKYTHEELIGRDLNIINSGHHAKTFFNDLWTIIESGQIWRGELCNIAKDRSIYWADTSIVPFLNEDGKPFQYLSIQIDITEHKRAEYELAENEKRLTDILQNIPEAVYTCDAEGYIKMYNKAAVTLWGREPLPGKDRWCGSWKIFNKDGSALNLDMCPMAIALKEGKPVVGKEIIVKRSDGTLRHVLPNPTPLFNKEGKLTGAINMLIDITDKKEREILIIKTEEKYRNLIELASEGVFLFDRSGNIKSVNQSGCSMLGYDKATLLQLNLQDIIPPKYTGKLPVNIADLKEKQAQLFEAQWRRKDGSLFFTEVSAHLASDGNVQAIVRDITERRATQKKMERAIERYDILAKATSDTIWDWDIKNDQIVYNEGMTHMFGFEKNFIENGTSWRKDNIHPNDQKKVAATLEETFKSTKQTLQFEYRYRTVENTYKDILDRAYIIYDKKGRPVRMIGAMKDITIEKNQEKLIAKAIIDTGEKERLQIGMELHDNVNQLLSASLLYLSIAADPKTSGIDLLETINNCKSYINEAIGDIRMISHRIAPQSRRDISIKELIEMLVKPLKETNRFEINLHIGEFNRNEMGDDIQTNLYRILQEQLNNIIKYSEAGIVDICIKKEADIIRLRIADNGVGFEPGLIKEGIGFRNIRKRAELLSGLFILNSSPGKGCELIVTIPINIIDLEFPALQ